MKSWHVVKGAEGQHGHVAGDSAASGIVAMEAEISRVKREVREEVPSAPIAKRSKSHVPIHIGNVPFVTGFDAPPLPPPTVVPASAEQTIPGNAVAPEVADAAAGSTQESREAIHERLFGKREK